MLLLQHSKCSTCLNARNWLNFHKFSYTSRDIIQDNPTYEELSEWHKKSELPIKRLFNTSGILYKSMGLKDKLSYMSDEECFKLLSTDGMLVKRPILVWDDKVLVGFKVDIWREIFKTEEKSI